MDLSFSLWSFFYRSDLYGLYIGFGTLVLGVNVMDEYIQFHLALSGIQKLDLFHTRRIKLLFGHFLAEGFSVGTPFWLTLEYFHQNVFPNWLVFLCHVHMYAYIFSFLFSYLFCVRMSTGIGSLVEILFVLTRLWQWNPLKLLKFSVYEYCRYLLNLWPDN